MAEEREDVVEARKRLKQRYGAALASKASPSFAKLFGGAKESDPFTTAPEGMPKAAQQVLRPGTPIVLDCAQTSVERATHALGDAAGPESAPPNPAVRRLQLVQSMRNDFEARASDVRGGLDAMTAQAHADAAGPEAAPAMLTGGAELCWLNSTMRSVSDPRVVAELAGDDLIEGIGLDSPLEREIHDTVPLIGAPDFRTAAGVDGSGIIIAVIDGEADTNHPALQGHAVRKRNYTLSAWGNPDRHGTAVAGIAGSAAPGHLGVAPGATIWSFKVFPAGTTFQGVLAIQEALSDGAHITNCSWRSGFGTDGTGRAALAVNNAWLLGMVMIKSAGNSGPGANTVTPPADAVGVIVVGATNRAGTHVADYSSRGPTDSGLERPHLVAPGGDGRQRPGISTPRPGGGFHDAGSGTSYAAPKVAGAAALLLQQDPSLSPDDVRDQLIAASHTIGSGDPNEEGAGLLDLKNLISPL